jgi:hypothetical protein
MSNCYGCKILLLPETVYPRGSVQICGIRCSNDGCSSQVFARPPGTLARGEALVLVMPAAALEHLKPGAAAGLAASALVMPAAELERPKPGATVELLPAVATLPAAVELQRLAVTSR